MLALADSTAQHILQHIPLGLDSTVLEFGCGLGLISETLAMKVGFVTGVDIAPNMVEVGGSSRAAAAIRQCK
jgi:predicted TPR repeat methyltransferase